MPKISPHPETGRTDRCEACRKRLLSSCVPCAVVQRFLAGESIQSLARDYFGQGFGAVDKEIAHVEAILRRYVRRWPRVQA